MTYGRDPGDALQEFAAERAVRRRLRWQGRAHDPELAEIHGREGLTGLLLSLLDLALYGLFAGVSLAVCITALALVSRDVASPWLALAIAAAVASMVIIYFPLLKAGCRFDDRPATASL